MEKRFYTITPVTGVHIGTGEELTPLDYKITPKIEDVDFHKPMYWKISGDKILQRLCGDEKAMTAFERASVEGNMKELYKFFHDNCTHIKDTDYFCEITKEFLKKYTENLDKNPHQNAAKVLEMYRTEGTPKPVIPGSSVKGSVRTALLNGYLADLSDKDYQYIKERFEQEKNLNKANEKMQQKLFDYGDAKNDPLRAVLFSDCSFKFADTQLVGGLDLVSFNKQTGSLEAIGAQIQAEVLRGELLGGKAASELCIDINDMLQKTPFPPKYDYHQKQEKPPKRIKTITFEDIHKSCNEFYWGEFQNEYDKFFKNVNDGSEGIITKLMSKLKAAVSSREQFIIRVGRWSQVEFVTFEDNFRKPLTKKDKFGKSLGYGGTRTLFNYNGDYVPLGWCILTVKE